MFLIKLKKLIIFRIFYFVKIIYYKLQFIDVRDKESFSKGTIGNAIHLDRAFLEFYLAEGSPLKKENPDKEYVVFCVGGQGTLSTKTMKDMGIKNVKNITGGMAELIN